MNNINNIHHLNKILININNILIDKNPTTPLYKKEILDRYKRLVEPLESDIIFQIGFITLPELNSLKSKFNSLSGYIKKNQILNQNQITRDKIPYNKNIRLACNLIKINNKKDIIYPLRIINKIKFKQIYRPYESWINPLKKANTKKYSVENNWEIVIKRFNSVQKKKLKQLTLQEKRDKKNKKE